MNSPTHEYLDLRNRKPLAITCLALAAISIVFVWAQSIGGETTDEWIHEAGYREVIAFAEDVLARSPDADYSLIRNDLEFYGILPVAPTTVIHDALAHVFGLSNRESASLYRFLLHLSAYLWALGTVILLFKLLRSLTVDRILPLLGALFLFLYPAWLGHSFFNYKDVPLAFMVLLAVYGASIVQRGDDESFNRGLVLLAVATVGAAAIKIAGGVLLIVPWLAVGLEIIRSAQWRDRLIKLIAAIAIVCAGIFILTPAAWREPLYFVFDTIDYMSKHAWSWCMVSRGDCLNPTSPDWSVVDYLWRWLLVRLPLVVLALIVPAALYLLIAGNKQDRLVTLSIAVPLSLIVLRNSSLYDGIRHIIFAVPIFICIVVVAADKVAAKVRQVGQVFKIILMANMGLFVIDNVTLFPYNYVYFNEISRNYASPALYDLEYWGFSMKEVARDIRRDARINYPDNKKIYYYDFLNTTTPYLNKRFKRIIKKADLPESELYYTTGNTRLNTLPAPNCAVISAVERRLIFAPEPLYFVFATACNRPAD